MIETFKMILNMIVIGSREKCIELVQCSFEHILSFNPCVNTGLFMIRVQDVVADNIISYIMLFASLYILANIIV